MVAQRFRQSDFVMRSGTSVLHSSYGSFLTSNLLLGIIARADTLLSLLVEKLHTFGGAHRHDINQVWEGCRQRKAALCPPRKHKNLLTQFIKFFEFRH